MRLRVLENETTTSLQIQLMSGHGRPRERQVRDY